MRLERSLQLRRRRDRDLDGHLGGGECRLCVAARVVRRLADELMVVDGRPRVDDVPEDLDLERERAHAPHAPPPACRRRRSRSAGLRTPARRRAAARSASARARSRGRSRRGRRARREPRSRSSTRRARAAAGDRRTAACSMPGSRDVDRLASATGCADIPSKRGAGRPTRESSASGAHVRTSSASSTSAQTSS